MKRLVIKIIVFSVTMASAIFIEFARGENSVLVPDLTGLAREAAVDVLSSRGLVVNQIQELSLGVQKPGTVYNQYPKANEQVVPGTAVQIYIEYKLDPGMNSGGIIYLMNYESFNLDNDTDDNTRTNGDIYFIGEGDEFALEPENGSKLAKLAPSLRSPQDCIHAEFSDSPIKLDRNMTGGDFICILTNRGRYSLLQLEELVPIANEPKLKIRFATWDKFNVAIPPLPASPPAEVVLFYAEPTSIEPGRVVNIYWDTANARKVELSSENGRGVVVSPSGARQYRPTETTNYKITAFGANDQQQTKATTVSVIKPQCRQRSINLARQVIYPLGSGSRESEYRDYGGLPDFGDTEMGGHSAEISIEATVFEHAGQLILDASVEMVEKGGDRSSFYKHQPNRKMIRLMPTGCTLKHPKKGYVKTHSKSNNHKWTRYGGNGIIKGAKCRSDTSGNDKGKLGCEIDFNPIPLDG
ncbi:MAG: PASTA domain-containing protein [Gammaproteobacteria bacterium]